MWVDVLSGPEQCLMAYSELPTLPLIPFSPRAESLSDKWQPKMWTAPSEAGITSFPLLMADGAKSTCP